MEEFFSERGGRGWGYESSSGLVLILFVDFRSFAIHFILAILSISLMDFYFEISRD